MSLLRTLVRKVSKVVWNQKHLTDNQKVIATRVFGQTPKNPLVLQSTSDNTTDYPDEDFTDASDEKGTAQGDSDDEEDEVVDGAGDEAEQSSDGNHI